MNEVQADRNFCLYILHEGLTTSKKEAIEEYANMIVPPNIKVIKGTCDVGDKDGIILTGHKLNSFNKDTGLEPTKYEEEIKGLNLYKCTLGADKENFRSSLLDSKYLYNMVKNEEFKTSGRNLSDENISLLKDRLITELDMDKDGDFNADEFDKYNISYSYVLEDRLGETTNDISVDDDFSNGISGFLITLKAGKDSGEDWEVPVVLNELDHKIYSVNQCLDIAFDLEGIINLQ